MPNLALFSNGRMPYVSSIAYNHHASRINDGIRAGEDASTSDVAWVSASERLPQWAAVVSHMVGRVERVEVYWGRGRIPESSRAVVVQGWVDGAWITIKGVQTPEPEPRTVLAFEPVRVEAVRVWQDADGGPESTPGRMHVAQLEAYGEFVEGAAVEHLKIRDTLREEWEDNFRASRREITREENTGIRLAMIGQSDREIVNGKGEGFGVFGQSPWDACVAVRQTCGGERNDNFFPVQRSTPGFRPERRGPLYGMRSE